MHLPGGMKLPGCLQESTEAEELCVCVGVCASLSRSLSLLLRVCVCVCVCMCASLSGCLALSSPEVDACDDVFASAAAGRHECHRGKSAWSCPLSSADALQSVEGERERGMERKREREGEREEAIEA